MNVLIHSGYIFLENDRTDDPFMMYAYFGWVAVVTCIILLIIWIRRYKRNRCRRQLQPQIVTFQPQQYINNVCINQEGVQIGSHPSTVNMLPSYEEVTVSPHQAEEPHGNMKPGIRKLFSAISFDFWNILKPIFDNSTHSKRYFLHF